MSFVLYFFGDCLSPPVIIALVVIIIAYLFQRYRPRSIPNIPFPDDHQMLLGSAATVSKYASERRSFFYFHENSEKFGGKMFQLRTLHTRFVVTQNADTIKTILSDMKHFQRNKNFETSFADVARGMLVMEGDEWARHRKLASRAFVPSRLNTVGNVTCDVVDTLSNMWVNSYKDLIASEASDASLTDNSKGDSLDGPSSPLTVDVASICTSLAMDVFGRAGFGCEFNSLQGADHDIANDLAVAFSAIGRRAQVPKMLWPLMKDHSLVEEAKKNIFAFIESLMADRLAAWRKKGAPGDGRDILSLFLSAGIAKDLGSGGTSSSSNGSNASNNNSCRGSGDSSNDDGDLGGDKKNTVPSNDALSIEEIGAELLLFYAAGHETTANTLAWVLYVLAERPNLCERLRTELRDSCGLDTGVGHPTHEDIGKTPLLDAVINETMRLYPVVPMTGREAKTDCVLEGNLIPAGTSIMMLFYSAQRSERYWGPTAKEFDETRWLNGEPEGFHAFFGLGPKKCIGFRFATIELKFAIAALVRRFDFTRPAGAGEVKPVFTVTLGPKDGLFLEITPRDLIS